MRWTSIRDDRDLHYDYGTHIPCLTGETELDEILYGSLDDLGQNWHRIHKIAPISRHGGVWNSRGSLLDANVLPGKLYNQGVKELQLAINLFDDLETFLNNSIGPPLLRS